jgi:hypothetical protein
MAREVEADLRLSLILLDSLTISHLLMIIQFNSGWSSAVEGRESICRFFKRDCPEVVNKTDAEFKTKA